MCHCNTMASNVLVASAQPRSRNAAPEVHQSEAFRLRLWLRSTNGREALRLRLRLRSTGGSGSAQGSNSPGYPRFGHDRTSRPEVRRPCLQAGCHATPAQAKEKGRANDPILCPPDGVRSERTLPKPTSGGSVPQAIAAGNADSRYLAYLILVRSWPATAGHHLPIRRGLWRSRRAPQTRRYRH